MTTPQHDTSGLAVEEKYEAGPERSFRLTGQPIGRTFVTLYILAIVGLWTALLTPASVTLALRVADLDPANKVSSLALVAGVGSIFSTLANPIFGRLSDMSASRFGRRRPFVLGGAVCGVAALVVIGLAPNIMFVLLGWCLAQIAFGAAIAALVAVLPDRVPENKRGKVSGLMGMTNQVAQVCGVFLVQVTGTTGVGMFLLPAGIGLVFVLAFTFYLKEVPQSRDEVARWSLMDIPRSLWINPLVHRDFAWAFLSRFLVWTGKAMLLTYKTYFLMDHLGYTSKEAAEILGYTMAILAVGVILASNVSGWLSDKLERRKIFIVVASLIFGTGMITIAFSTTLTGFMIGVAIASIGQGIYVGVDFALLAAVLPHSDKEAAKGMGIFNVANALPQSIAPAIAPMILAIGAGAGSSGNYQALYLSAGLFAVLGAIAVQFVRGSR